MSRSQHPLNAAELRELFESRGALRSGHFKLSSGRHSDSYFQCALPLSDPKTAERLGRALAARMPAGWGRPAAVVSPALGGVIIGHETARALGTPFFFTERKDGLMAMRRGFSLEPGTPVVVVEDVVTTGKSTGEVVALLKNAGVRVAGALAIVLRAAEDPVLGVPLASLARFAARSYAEGDCPLCGNGVPIEKPGSRTERGPTC